MKAFRSFPALLALFLALSAAAANAPRQDLGAGRPDVQFQRALERVREGRLDDALGELDRIIARHPNFRLAHLVRGDLLLARAKPIAGFGNTTRDANGRLGELRAEALLRLRAYDSHPPEGQVPRYLLQLDPRQKNAIVIDGCIALANPDIESLAKRVQVGATPVIIAERGEWLSPQAWRAERDAFLRQLEAWRNDWESLDTERYLAHYAKGFRSGAMDPAAWRAHKRKVGAGKTSIKVSLDNLGVFRSPGRQELVEVSFDQDYRSNNLSQRTRKRQYWVQEDGRWKIAYEAPLQGGVKVALPESFPGKRN